MIHAERNGARCRVRATAAAMALLLFAGCASNKAEKTVLGVRRVALDLAYSDDALKVIVPPSVIVQFVPAAPEAIAALVPGSQRYLPTREAPPLKTPLPCPKAPPGAVPAEPATVAFATQPVAGTYVQRNVGTIKVGGALPLTFPYPSLSKLVLRDVKVEDMRDSSNQVVRTTSFVVEDQILPTYKIVSSYAYDAKVLNLVRRDVINGATTTIFRPTPVVEVFAFAGPGASWDAAGVDTSTLDALTVHGSIGSTEAVDVCGVLVDAERASTDEHRVDTANRSQSGTRSGMPSITHYATQFGGLPVRREQHTTEVVRTDSGPVTLDTDVVSTLVSIKPIPPGGLS